MFEDSEEQTDKIEIPVVLHQALHVRHLNTRESPSSFNVRCKHTVCLPFVFRNGQLQLSIINNTY